MFVFFPSPQRNFFTHSRTQFIHTIHLKLFSIPLFSHQIFFILFFVFGRAVVHDIFFIYFLLLFLPRERQQMVLKYARLLASQNFCSYMCKDSDILSITMTFFSRQKADRSSNYKFICMHNFLCNYFFQQNPRHI